MWNWLYKPTDASRLDREVEKVVACLKDGRIPPRLRMGLTKYPSVLM